MPKSKSLFRKTLLQGTQTFYTCFNCNTTSSSKIGLRLHNKSIHKINVGYKDELKFYCAACQFEFVNEFKFKNHLVKEHKGCWRETVQSK